jgi:hypothetical protein
LKPARVAERPRAPDVDRQSRIPMSAHIQAFGAAGGPAVTRLFRIKFGVLAVLAGLVPLLAGCADAPRLPAAGPDPADPGTRVPRVDYRSTLGSYRSQRPVDPASWVEQNERVAPAPKSGQ